MPESPQRRRRDSFTASLPDPFQILGLKLKPLSLGRYRLLRRLDNAFVSDTAQDFDPADLILGVAVCSHRVDEMMEILEHGDLSKRIRKWSRTICPWPMLHRVPFVGAWWRKKYAFNILEKVALFKQYIAHHTEMPPYWDLTEDTPPSGSHWSHGVEIILRSQLGWTTEDINEAPMSKALFDYLGWAESQGSVKLIADYELQAIEDATKN